MRFPGLMYGLALAGAIACRNGDTGDTSDTGDSGDSGDSGDTDSGDTDSGDTDTADTGDTGDTDTGAGPVNWDFEDWTSSDPPPGFSKGATGSWTVTEDAGVQGDAAAALTLTDSAATRELSANGSVSLPNAGTWQFHAWIEDDDPDVAARLVAQSYFGTTPITALQAPDPTSDAPGWVEYTLDVPTTTATTLSPRLRVEEVTGSPTGSVIRTDAWAITRPFSFVVDGTTDAAAKPVAGTPGTTMDIAAAINAAGLLYVTTNKADLDSDHLLFVWVGPPAPDQADLVAVPWIKAGLVAGPSADGTLLVLIQEQSGDRFCDWLLWSGSNWTGAPDATCSANAGSRLDGTVSLPEATGLSAARNLPRDLYVQVAPWESGDGTDGEMKPQYQVPPGNGDTIVDPDEVIEVNRIDLLVGQLPAAP